jgi:hypothetical protein
LDMICENRDSLEKPTKYKRPLWWFLWTLTRELIFVTSNMLCI